MLAKCTPPQNHNIIDRTRLFNLMIELRSKSSTTWISAPPGSGKTSFVISYLNHINRTPLWFQVDEGDKEIASFFYFLKLAAEKFTLSENSLIQYSPEYRLGVRAFARKYFRELFAVIGDHKTLVFDNVHEAGIDSELYDILDCICEEVPHNIQLIFISRHNLPKQLARLHLNQNINFIDMQELKFTQDEVSDITRSFTKTSSVNSENLEHLFSQANGWITGIILILRQLKLNEAEQNKDLIQFEACNNYRYLFDYFANELFNRLDERCQSFLTKVIYLSQITVTSALEITGSSQSSTILENLENDNYFLTRKMSTDITFEFHALFQEFLFRKSQQFLNISEIQNLRLKSASIALDKKQFDAAANLYYQTKSWDQLKSLIISQAGQMEKQGRQPVVQTWISYLPQIEIESNAKILYWEGFSQLYYNPFSAYESLKKAYHLFLSEKNGKWSYLAWTGISISLYLKHDNNYESLVWLKEIATLKKKFVSFPSPEVKSHIAVEAFNLNHLSSPNSGDFKYWLSETEKIEMSNTSVELRCIAGSRLAVYYAFYGIPDKLTAISQRVHQYSNSTEVRPIIRILALWTEITASWMSGNPVENDKLINKALELGQDYGLHTVELWVLSAAIYSSLIYNKLDIAFDYLKSFVRHGKAKQRIFHSHYYYLLGWYELSDGNISVGHEHIQYAVKSIEGLNTPLFEIMHKVALAKSYILLADYKNADSVIAQITTLSKRISNTHYLKYIVTMLISWSALRQSNHDLAIENLSECFKFGSETNIISGGSWLRIMLTELCELALSENIEVDYAQRLIQLYNLVPSNNAQLIGKWPYRIKIFTLSDFRLLINSQVLQQKKKSSKKALELIKTIIAFGDRSLKLDSIANALWPDQEADAAINALNTTLHRLRKLIGADAVILHSGQISLNKHFIWVDVWQVETQLNHLSKKKVDDDFIQIFADILDIYLSQFLIENDESTSYQSLRFRVQEKFNRQALRLGLYYENNQQFTKAKSLYNEVLERDDSIEDYYIGLMRCALVMGNAAEGMIIYRRCIKLLNDKFGIAPGNKIELLRSKLQKIDFKPTKQKEMLSTRA